MNYKKLILESEDGIVFELVSKRKDTTLTNIELTDSKKAKGKSNN